MSPFATELPCLILIDFIVPDLWALTETCIFIDSKVQTTSPCFTVSPSCFAIETTFPGI